MVRRRFGTKLTVDEQAGYRIIVQGQLDERWSERLGGMLINVSYELNKEGETVLTGRLSDQAALAGILNTLYELHLPLLSVEYLNADERVDGSQM